MTHLETRYLPHLLETIDELVDKRKISDAEYIQIGLLLKILETLNDIKNVIRVQK